MGKKCSTCDKTKSIKEFGKNRNNQDGYQRQCKSCCKAYQEIYRQSDVGKEARRRHSQSEKGKGTARKRNRRYGQSNAGKGAQKRYKQSDKGKQVSTRSNRRYKQSEKSKKATKRYEQSEKGMQSRKKRNATRRTRKTQAGGFYTVDEWYNLCKFYNFQCLKCKRQFPFEKLSLDHIRPVSKGGSSYIWNTQPLCRNCNSSKGNKEIDYRKTLPDWINRDGPVWQQDTLF